MKILRRQLFLILTAIILPFSPGCSTAGSSIPLGTAANFSPTDPAKIEFLIEEPTRPHVKIALVEGTAATDDYFTAARTQAAALDAMKKEAARLGAHAIILAAKGSTPYGQVIIANTTGTARFATTTGVGLGWEKITLSGTAIRYKE